MQPHEEHLCHACRRPLNAYPFVARLDRTNHLFCGATCYVSFARERRHRTSIGLSSRLGSFCGASNERKTSAEAEEGRTEKQAFIAVTAFLTGVVLAIGALA
jgi:hypothetical protein